MDLGLEIVASALREGTLKPFLAAGINRAWLSDGVDLSSRAVFDTLSMDAYHTLLNHWDRHGKTPTLDIFQRSHPPEAYRLPKSEYTPAELVEMVVEDRRRWLTEVAVVDMSDKLRDGDVDAVPSIIQEFQAQIAVLRGANNPLFREATLTQLDDLKQPEPLIEGIVDAGTVTMLSGPYGTGKSFIALDWALCIASGTDWMGHAVEQCRVLYIAAEGAYGLRKRVKAWRALHPDAWPDDNIRLIIDPVQLGEPAHLDALLDDAKNFDVVVVDTVARCSVGMEENSAKDMGRLIDALYKLRDAHSEGGTTVIPVHHTGHDKSRARGSSALPAGVDAVFLTEAAEPHTLITLKSTKRKDGPPPAQMHMRLVESEDSVVLESVDAIFAEANSHGDRSRHIIEYLGEHPGANQQEIADAIGDSPATVSRTMKNLSDTGKVVEQKQGSSKRYYLPEA